jgi:hypothetical protein
MRIALTKLLPTLFAALLPGIAAAISFSGDIRVSNVAGISINPRLAAHNGTLHMVWMESAGADFRVYYARSTNNGDSWETPRAISGTGAFWPSVSAGANGVNVFWNTDPTSGDVFHARSTDNGATFSTGVNLTPGTAGYSRDPRTITDSQGRVHVVWYDSRRLGNAGDVFHMLSCDGGATWGPQVNVTTDDGIVDSEAPRLAEVNGTIYLSFRSTREGSPQGGWPPFTQFLLRSRAVDCGAKTVAWRFPAARLSPGLPDEFTPTYSGTIVAGNQGRLHAAYWQTKAGANVSYRRGVPGGAGFSAPVNLSNFASSHSEHFGVTVDGSDPAIAEDADNRVHVFYVQNDAIFQDFQVGRLWYRESTDGGVTFGAASQVSPATQALTPNALFHNGRVHLVWADYRDNNTGPEIYHKYSGGTAGCNVLPGVDTDGDGVPDCTEITLGLNPAVKDNDVFGNARLFAMQTYRDFLGREGDAGGIDFWTNQIATGGQTRAAMSQEFFNSAEFQANVAPIARLYFATYLRIPDTAGLLFWLGQFKNGQSLDAIANVFASSPEFTARYGNLSNADFVNFIYSNLFNRMPDTAGFNFWLGQLNGGLARGSMLASFSESAEYKSVSFTSVYVTMIYVALTQRAPDQGGFDFWTGQLRAGASGLTLINGFLGSPEYRSRFLP